MEDSRLTVAHAISNPVKDSGRDGSQDHQVLLKAAKAANTAAEAELTQAEAQTQSIFSIVFE